MTASRDVEVTSRKMKGQYPDYIDDPAGLERFRLSVRQNPGHDMAPVNYNSLGRLIDTIDRLSQPQSSDVGAAWLSRGDAHVALWQAIDAIKLGNRDDDKLIVENLRQAGIALARFSLPNPDAPHQAPTPDAVRRAALEEAARVCDHAAEGSRILHNSASVDRDTDDMAIHGEAWRVAKGLASDIRALAAGETA